MSSNTSRNSVQTLEPNGDGELFRSLRLWASARSGETSAKSCGCGQSKHIGATPAYSTSTVLLLFIFFRQQSTPMIARDERDERRETSDE